MTITIEHIQHLCKLAALRLSPEDEQKFTQQLDSIVGLVSKLEKLEITNTGSRNEIILGHINTSVNSSNFDVITNIKHTKAGHMPAISFSTKEQ